MTALRRVKACGFDESQAVPLSKIRELDENGILPYIKPVESLFTHLNEIHITDKQAFRFSNGGNLALSRLKGISDSTHGTLYRVYNNYIFIGLGSVEDQFFKSGFEQHGTAQ